MPGASVEITKRYSEVWTTEDGGRWRTGIEHAAMVLRAAGYQQVKPREWHTANAAMPRKLRCTVASAWPFTTRVEVIK